MCKHLEVWNEMGGRNEEEERERRRARATAAGNGRGSAGKAKERATEEKASLKVKGGEFGRKGKQHETRTRKDENNGEGHELGRMAPNMGAGGSHPQAISDPEKERRKGRDPKDEMGRL